MTVYDQTPLYDITESKKSSIVCVSSRLSIPMLCKYLKVWERTTTRMMENAKTNRSSIIVGNMNIRKIKMLLMVRGKWIQPMFEYGRVPLNPEVRLYILKKYNFRCCNCGRVGPKNILHIDHIKPISKGGSNNEDNLQILCRSCNLKKHTNEWKGGL